MPPTSTWRRTHPTGAFSGSSWVRRTPAAGLPTLPFRLTGTSYLQQQPQVVSGRQQTWARHGFRYLKKRYHHRSGISPLHPQTRTSSGSAPENPTYSEAHTPVAAFTNRLTAVKHLRTWALKTQIPYPALWFIRTTPRLYMLACQATNGPPILTAASI